MAKEKNQADKKSEPVKPITDGDYLISDLPGLLAENGWCVVGKRWENGRLILIVGDKHHVAG